MGQRPLPIRPEVIGLWRGLSTNYHPGSLESEHVRPMATLGLHVSPWQGLCFKHGLCFKQRQEDHSRSSQVWLQHLIWCWTQRSWFLHVDSGGYVQLSGASNFAAGCGPCRLEREGPPQFLFLVYIQRPETGRPMSSPGPHCPISFPLRANPTTNCRPQASSCSDFTQRMPVWGEPGCTGH